jgi:hypothetical protein
MFHVSHVLPSNGQDTVLVMAAPYRGMCSALGVRMLCYAAKKTDGSFLEGYNCGGKRL